METKEFFSEGILSEKGQKEVKDFFNYLDSAVATVKREEDNK